MGDLWSNGRTRAQRHFPGGPGQTTKCFCTSGSGGGGGEVKCMLANRQDSFGVTSWRSRSQKRDRTELGREENGELHCLHSQG